VETGDNVVSARYTSRWGDPASVRTANTVNCSDCSVISTTFSRILGGNAGITHISGPALLNPIAAIGHNAFGYPDFGNPGAPKGFSYHAFMTTDSQASVYDACLRVGQPNPTLTNAVMHLPSGMSFANVTNVTATLPVAGSNTGNGSVVVTVYDQNNHRGVVPANVTVACTNVAGGLAYFHIDCRTNGTATAQVATNVSATVVGTVYVPNSGNPGSGVNGVRIVDVAITQGTTPFTAGDSFSFELQCDFSSYWYALAAPDGRLGWDGTLAADTDRVVKLGRTSVVITTPPSVTPGSVE
jgi:hypothetical protein